MGGGRGAPPRQQDPIVSGGGRWGGGATAVPIVHQGFVWSPADFHGLLDPATAPRNLSNRHDHSRGGLGATQVVVRRNLHQDSCDGFLHDAMYFPATAVLRPDLDSWLGGGGPGGDVLELYDPLRVGAVALPGGVAPLASDVDAPMSFLAWSTSDGESGWAGLLNPSQDVNRAFLGLLEPFQPGKIPVFFVHGMFDSPYTFSDLMNGLRLKPGFLDRYQIAGYRYATGMTFLHSAAQFRERLRAFEAAFDPWRSDPGVQDSVFVGHSLGGLLIKLQLVSSGEAFWNLVSNRPLETLAATEQTRASLASLFHFDPVPFARRAVFMATPHGGLTTFGKTGETLNEVVNRPPRDLDPLIAEVAAANPGAILPYMRELPSGVSVLRGRDPIHQALHDLPIAAYVRYHTVAGTGRVTPSAVGFSDGVVPVASAVLEGAESQTLIPEWHTTMNYSEYALAEVDRILKAHLAG